MEGQKRYLRTTEAGLEEARVLPPIRASLSTFPTTISTRAGTGKPLSLAGRAGGAPAWAPEYLLSWPNSFESLLHFLPDPTALAHVAR